MTIASRFLKKSRAVPAPVPAQAPVPRRTMHGTTGWAATTEQRDVYQPQDQSTESSMPAASLRGVGVEPEDARITGGTRSLMRRLSGLNFLADSLPKAVPASALRTA